ncbi:MAG: 1-deoxy-D-xylulose-5-phosphate reductoisomerase [Thermoleophilia bacterium]|nr:1-deoxy-D-xylulose-5-phosphate reductoisomerase [Thermoleophilia bacterium]
MRRVIVLGATGSVGVQALRVIACSRDLKVVGLSCAKNVALLLEQAVSLGVNELAIADEEAARTVSPTLYPELRVRSGADASARLVDEVDADVVLNAIVGFAGLQATLAALSRGTVLALANKESLVCAGSLVMGLAASAGAAIIPVDSEHSAIYQLLAGISPDEVETVVLTASGGPFRGRKRDQLRAVTPEEALAHPTWSMGPKITIDSATLMNKALEIIEAHHLFGLSYEQIEVLVHPQSIVHGLVRLKDGAFVAHLGATDMRIPIAYALNYPNRTSVQAASLDLAAGVALEFFSPDEDTFPSLSLAREAGRKGDVATCALNAANEVAVEAFLGGELTFLGIWEVVQKVISESPGGSFGTYEEARWVDEWAREVARQAVNEQRLRKT